MINSFSIAPACYECGQALRRRVWHPLRRTMEIFHVLPLTAAILVFGLLATQPQLREIYLSYLEGLKDPAPGDTAANLRIFIAAAVGLGLISAALYEAHYWLSTMRINIAYSSLSDPESGSALRRLQRIAAIGLALVPWLGVVAGLFDAKLYLVKRYDQLRDAGINPDTMNYVARPGTGSIFIAMLVLAIAVAFFLDRFLDRDRRSFLLQTMTVAAIPVAAIGLFFLLTDLPLEALRQSRLGIAAVAVICAIFYLVYWRLYTMRTGWIYTQATFADTGINRRRRRRIALFALAMVPWLALGLYCALTPLSRTAAAGLPFGSTVAGLPALSQWAIIPVMMSWVVAAGLAVAMLLDHFRESPMLPKAIIGLVVALMFGAWIVSYGNVDTIVGLYRGLGPLASAMLMLLFAVMALTLLAALSQKSGFPALTLVVLVVIVNAIFPVPVKITAFMLIGACALFVIMALLSRLWAVAAIATFLMLPPVVALVQQVRSGAVKPYEGPASDLKEKYKAWLNARTDASSAEKYPVFIVAAEGGGIYAASAVSLFLAKLEDDNPGFSRHVFAISGVSGGAIGATVFQALMQSKFGPPAAGAAARPNGCSERSRARDKPAPTPLVATVSCIMQDDHLSPVVGAIIPEFLGAAAVGRAEAVAGSFRYSVDEEDGAAGKALGKDFAQHWSETSAAPALLLNSTWAETGFRVAFAPFALHAYDDSLYSFTDKNMPGHRAGGKEMDLIDAAVVSARFPGMLPPYSITMDENGAELPWNFVDGGYSDNSGASTALAIYRALASDPGNAEIKIILLTSSNPQPDLTPNKVSIAGTSFRDTVAPITALLKVRQGLGNQAVARVCEELKQELANPTKTDQQGAIRRQGDEKTQADEKTEGDCTLKASRPESPLKIVELEVETYNLPLGWKLSRTTFAMVRWMMGDPRRCRTGNAGVSAGADSRSSEDNEINEHTVERNSCVHKWVGDLLKSDRAGRR